MSLNENGVALTAFQRLGLETTMQIKLYRSSYFDLTALQSMAKALERSEYLAGTDYEVLRGLHCVAWADMGPGLTRMVREKAVEMLGMQLPEVQQEVEEVEPKPARTANWMLFGKAKS